MITQYVINATRYQRCCTPPTCAIPPKASRSADARAGSKPLGDRWPHGRGAAPSSTGPSVGLTCWAWRP